MKIAIGSDAAGFELKEFISAKLQEAGHTVTDLGTRDKADEVKYMYAQTALPRQCSPARQNAAWCSAGPAMGVSICANKHKGVYCAVVESQWAAYNARFINNANVLAMGERIIAPVMAWDIAQTFLNTEFHQGANETRSAILGSLF